METYSTDQICQLCGVSRKQLRHYEERGVISKVPRQIGNNYRYYTQEHIGEIVAAKALRNIDMPLGELKDIVFGKNIESVRRSLQQQLSVAREILESSIRNYEQSAIVYAKLTEAFSILKLQNIQGALEMKYEVVERPAQDIVSLSYDATWEDEDGLSIEYLPQIQTISQGINCVSYASLIYLTYGHFDSQSCQFNHQIHNYKIAVPVVDRKKYCLQYDSIPEVRGVSAIHVGGWKNRKLHDTYVNVLNWAKKQGYKLANWSIEEWLISPMITSNKDLWVIQITIPFQ